MFAMMADMLVEEDVVYEFSRPQLTASNEMFDNFKNDTTRHNVLLAQMQSGKTETYLLAACRLLVDSQVDQVIIFSGTAELCLKKQLEDTVSGKIGVFYKKLAHLYSTEQRVSLEEARRQVDLFRQQVMDKKVKILWGVELNKYRGPSSRTLFIWEEAHYAQTEGQKPDKFLQRLQIPADGNFHALKERNNYMITISATPFSELVDLMRNKQSKKVCFMEPGDGYNSVKKIKESGHLHPFKTVEEGLERALTAAGRKRCYAIVRVFKPKTEEKVAQICLRKGWEVVYFDSLKEGEVKRRGEEVWEEMIHSVEPPHPIVIIIHEKCRMGHNLSKKYLSFVMETSINPATDTILQGLLGRVCGYPESRTAEDNIYNVDVYLSKKSMAMNEDIDKYIEMIETQHDGQIEVVPGKAKNLVTHTNQVFQPISPFKLTRDESITDRKQDIENFVVESLRSGRFEHKNGRSIQGEVCSKVCEAYDQDLIAKGKDEFGKFWFRIHEISPDREICGKDFALDMVRCFQSGESKEFVNAKRTDIKTDEIDIFIFTKGTGKKTGTKGRYVDMGSPDFDYNTVFVTSHVFPSLTEELPITTRKEVFVSRLADQTPVVSNGAFMLLMPIETCDSVELMKTTLSRFVEISQTEPSTRQVSSLTDMSKPVGQQNVPIVVSAEVWEAIQSHGEIYAFIKRTHGVSLKCTVTMKNIKKQQKYGLMCLNSISW
jgi:hypothetical protein